MVKFESVMKLRKELESLGRMKGITKDEKGLCIVNLKKNFFFIS